MVFLWILAFYTLFLQECCDDSTCIKCSHFANAMRFTATRKSSSFLSTGSARCLSENQRANSVYVTQLEGFPHANQSSIAGGGQSLGELEYGVDVEMMAEEGNNNQNLMNEWEEDLDGRCRRPSISLPVASKAIRSRVGSHPVSPLVGIRTQQQNMPSGINNNNGSFKANFQPQKPPSSPCSSAATMLNNNEQHLVECDSKDDDGEEDQMIIE